MKFINELSIINKFKHYPLLIGNTIMLSNQTFTKKFLKRKQMLAKKVFDFLNDDYTDPASPYLALIEKHLAPQLTFNPESGYPDVQCKNTFNNMLLYCINEYTQ